MEALFVMIFFAASRSLALPQACACSSSACDETKHAASSQLQLLQRCVSAQIDMPRSKQQWRVWLNELAAPSRNKTWIRFSSIILDRWLSLSVDRSAIASPQKSRCSSTIRHIHRIQLAEYPSTHSQPSSVDFVEAFEFRQIFYGISAVVQLYSIQRR